MNTNKRYTVDICVTHQCNLDCIYCYQNHSGNSRMTFEICKNCVDFAFNNLPKEFDSIEFDFIGGEPLLEFELLKDITNYIKNKKVNIPYILFATTNGTLLDNKKKDWFLKNKDIFYLGLSLDGTKETHDYNRSNSFDKIDINFFLKTWPDQSVKMTLSEHSLLNLYENIKYIYSLGFNDIAGVNLAEGDFDWNKPELINNLAIELKKLECFYLENEQYKNNIFDKELFHCESSSKNITKWCGIGEGMIFFDYDGKTYPCPYCTPMTFSKKDINKLKKVDYKNSLLFLDQECFNNCYVYPICSTCAGNNYRENKSFNMRSRSKCKIQKLIILFSADYWAKKILNNKHDLTNTELFYTINAIKKIRELYLPEFSNILSI